MQVDASRVAAPIKRKTGRYTPGLNCILLLVGALQAVSWATSTTLMLPAEEGHLSVGADAVLLSADSFRDSVRVERDLQRTLSLREYTFRVAFSPIDRFEINAGLLYQSLDDGLKTRSRSASGFGAPSIGIKTAGEDLPLAAFVELGLPWGDSAVIGTDPMPQVLVGVLLDAHGGPLILRSALSYLWLTENNKFYDPGDQIAFQVEPGFRLNPMLAMDVRISATSVSKATIDGEEIQYSDGFSLLLGPGLRVTYPDWLETELRYQVHVAGRNAYSLGGLCASLTAQVF